MTCAWRRGLLPLIGSLAGLFLWVWPLRAAVVEPRVAESGSVIVTAETAEVREGPSSRSEVITVVAKGEVFLKQGRTGAWYLIRIDDDSFGWISGRSVRRYRGEAAEESPSPYVGPYEGRSSLYYPGGYPYYCLS